MQRDLAEKLLAQIMCWSDDEKAEEWQALQAFATYKYDEYQQFMPGRRFLESLALWLRQFESERDRPAAYSFVRKRLIFISNAEINHLVELAFPFFVRPYLIALAGNKRGLPQYRIKHIMDTKLYRLLLRQTLVLGLSDGARTDAFRRANPNVISNEQVWHAYDISNAKADDLIQSLKKDLHILLDRTPRTEELQFNTIVLLDDFTASGRSYLRENGSGELEGKIARIVNIFGSNEGLGTVVADTNVRVIVIIYVATVQAIRHIQQHMNRLTFHKGNIELYVVHELSHYTKLNIDDDNEILRLAGIDTYFDSMADDEHAGVGGSSVRLGFAECKLPVVLTHNTPNNSIFLLWSEDKHRVHGLFPRVSRHRKFE